LNIKNINNFFELHIYRYCLNKCVLIGKLPITYATLESEFCGGGGANKAFIRKIDETKKKRGKIFRNMSKLRIESVVGLFLKKLV